MDHHRAQHRPIHAARSLRAGRWCAFGLVSALLHLLAIQWTGDQLRRWTPAPRNEPPTISASLVTLPAAAGETAPRTRTATPPRRKPAPPPAAAPAAPSEPMTAGKPAPVPAGPDEAMYHLGDDASVPYPSAVDEADAGHVPAADETAGEPLPAEEAQQEAPRYAAAPPPSAVLEYTVQKMPRNGNPTHGHGTISWKTDGARYTIDGEAGVLFLTALTFRSEGMIDASGIAPVLYTEKRWRKPDTNTHFHHDRNTISFSASTLSYPRQGGEQDRASIMWQLAAIGRGDSTVFVPGAQISLFVAGTRDGEVWRIRVIGQEEMILDGGATMTWHVQRLPHAGSYDQAIDIWLAPQHQWVPVKLRYTERNGDYLDLTLSGMTLSATPDAPRSND